MYESDYMKRLIKACTNTAVALFAGKDAIKSEVDEETGDVIISEDELLEVMIKRAIGDGKINEAENILFEAIRMRKSEKNLQLALSFYKELSKWEEDKLESCNFSKEEIEQGLEDIKKLYEQK